MHSKTMKIKLIAIEDQVIGGYGWVLDSINGKSRFEYDMDEYLTAQDNPGRLLAHDILEHGCRVSINPNLDELAALGAIWANRDWEFHNGYRDNFAYEVGEQLAQYLNWVGDESIDSPCSSKMEDAFEEHYDNRIGEIEAVVTTELSSLMDIYEDDLDIDLDALHKLAKSYLAKGCNEVWRKESRYGCDFNSRYQELEHAIKIAL